MDVEKNLLCVIFSYIFAVEIRDVVSDSRIYSVLYPSLILRRNDLKKKTVSPFGLEDIMKLLNLISNVRRNHRLSTHRRHLPTILAFSTLLGTVGIMDAKEVLFSYSSPDDQVMFVGTSKAEIYDVAITLADPMLKGAGIAGVEIPVSVIPQLSDYSVWLSTALSLEADPETGKKVNAPNILSVPAEVKDGLLSVRFDTPYIIGEEPVYVGYSFQVSEVGRDSEDPARFPVAVTSGVTEGALMMHTQRHYLKWGDRGADLGGTSAIRVILDGDFPAADASITPVRDVKMQSAPTILIPLTLSSYSADPISSLEYTYTYQGKSNTVTQNFDEPLKTLFGMPASVTLEIPNDFELGVGPINITLDKVNGVANANSGKSAELTLSILRLLPKKRPVVEEYTGLWCGWCPRGYVGMETMSHEQPDFIGVAIHNEDPMEVTKDFPSPVAGFPSCYIDRAGSAKTPSVNGLRKYWGERVYEYTPVELTVDATSDDPTRKIEVRATYTFVEAPAHPCRLSYMILANGLTDPTWVQKNYFSNRNEENMEDFYGKPSDLTGLVYNDVLAMFSPFEGEEGSVPAPADIEPYIQMTHDYTFVTEGVKSLEEYDLIGAAKDNLTIVALMTDVETGEVMNAAKVRLGESGVAQNHVANAKVVKELYYDLAGALHLAPQPGMYVKYVFFEDGSRKAEKVVVR